jgi:Rieske Fe-S protein
LAFKKPRSLSLDITPCFARRRTLQLAMGAVAASIIKPLAAAAAQLPSPGDRLVRTSDEGTYVPLRASDIKEAGKPVIAYPYDVAANIVRSESRLNKVLLIHVDPSEMDSETRARAADDVLAFSAICTHQGCEVTDWAPGTRDLLCFCHFSKYAPLKAGHVVAGPAPRSLPTLPLALKEDELVVAGSFSASPGGARSGS